MNKHIQNIKEQGYTLIPQVFSPFEVKYLFMLVKKYYEETKDKTSKDVPYLNQSTPNIYNLQSKDLNFINALFKLDNVEEILKYFLNDKWYKPIPQDQPNYILRHFGARSSNEALPLHIDSFIPYIGEEVIAMQVAIMLEDSTLSNGCTTVIPGSHQSGKYAGDKMIGPIIPLEAKAGDILIWDSRLHHAATKNTTQGTRWAMIATFTRWWIRQMFEITDSLPKDIYEVLTPKEKFILGYGVIPYKDEYEGIDMKKGYDEL